MKVLYFDCSSGASGDMFLAALVDAGASEEAVRNALEALQLKGWSLSFRDEQRAGVRGRRAVVETSEGPDHRHYRDIRQLLEDAPLTDGGRSRARSIFERLAAAEAKIHGVAIDEVVFHEVGALDSIVDIVGVAAALEDLSPELVVCSAVVTGGGTVSAAHGELPVPAPAVTELLVGAPVVLGGDRELLTPTGAAIIAATADRFGDAPEMTLGRVGCGAGTFDDPQRPNILRVMVGDTTGHTAAPTTHVLLETNLDDMSPELIPYALERLLASGAQDAWTTPIVMKKGRPALTLTVLCTPEMLDTVLDVLYRETTTLGVRIRSTGKHELERRWTTVDVEGYEVRVKLGIHKGEIVNAAPEHEDAAKVARITGLPLKEVYRRASSWSGDSPD